MPKAVDLTPKKGMTFGKLLDAVASTPEPHGNGTSDADPLRLIGNAAFRGLLARMEEGQWLMPAASNGSGATTNLKDMVEAVDKLDAMRTRGEDRMARRLKEAEERADRAEQALAAAHDGQVSGLAAIVQAITAAMQAQNQQVMTLMQSQWQQTLQLIQEIRQQSRPSEDGLATAVIQNLVQRALERDPLGEVDKVMAVLERMSKQHAPAQATPPGLDPQALVAYLNYDLERFKAELEFRLRREGVERSREIAEKLAESLGKAARQREEHPAGSSSSPVAPPPSGYTYQCSECGMNFSLARKARQFTCPYCEAKLEAADGTATSPERTEHARPTQAVDDRLVTELSAPAP